MLLVVVGVYCGGEVVEAVEVNKGLFVVVVVQVKCGVWRFQGLVDRWLVLEGEIFTFFSVIRCGKCKTSVNIFFCFFFTIFGFSDIDLGGLAKGILSKSPVFYFLFEFEVG